MILIQSLSTVSVNVFVLVSGWYGIRPKIKSILNFIFQCLFYTIIIYTVSILIGISKFNIRGIMEIFYLTKTGWFIKAYLVLYAISPVLNSFVAQSSKETLKNVLIGFFILQTIFGWLTDSTDFFALGYSAISFIGLYLIARYINTHHPKWALFGKKTDLLIYLGISILSAIFIFIAMFKIGIVDQLVINNDAWEKIQWRIFSYSSPFIIIGSIYLVLFFSKLKGINKKWINILGASSFASYLIHTNPNIIGYYMGLSNHIHQSFSTPLFVLGIILLIISIFLISTLFDQVRLFVWSKIWNVYETKKADINK